MSVLVGVCVRACVSVHQGPVCWFLVLQIIVRVCVCLYVCVCVFSRKPLCPWLLQHNTRARNPPPRHVVGADSGLSCRLQPLLEWGRSSAPELWWAGFTLGAPSPPALPWELS